MLEFYIKCNSTEIRDGKGDNVIGRWHDGYAIHIKYDPVADANFIDLCEKNDDGTYHVAGHINHYVEWVQLCHAFGLYLDVTTADNLGGDELRLCSIQKFEYNNVEVEYSH